MIKKTEIHQEIIVGSRNLNNYILFCFLFLGGLLFFLAGVSSYFKINLLFFTDSKELVFIPQGLIMIFYGTLSFGISNYVLFTIFLDIGSGYNEYNKIENLVKIVRKGFPGKNRNILLTYSLNNIRAIGIKITESLNPQQDIYLCLKDERNIPLTSNKSPISINKLEKHASELAEFLNLKIENL